MDREAAQRAYADERFREVAQQLEAERARIAGLQVRSFASLDRHPALPAEPRCAAVGHFIESTETGRLKSW